jgi:hypothetical protein
LTLKIAGKGPRYPKLLDDGGEIPKISRKSLAVRFSSHEISSLLDKKNLPGGQLPLVLWRWHVGLLFENFQKIKNQRKITGHFRGIFRVYIMMSTCNRLDLQTFTLGS